MSNHDDDRPEDDGVYQPASDSQQRHLRKQIAIGAVGLAALLGTGAYVITAQVTDRQKFTATQDTGALAPLANTTASSASTPSEGPAVASSQSGPTKNPVKQPTGPASTPARSLSVDEQIKEAREKAAKDGYPVRRPATAAPGVKLATGPVEEHNQALKNGALRIVTAKHDLTGQRELLWAADEGEPVGENRCTQKFKFANNTEPSVKPNMLLCWRVSADRSVVTVLVDQGGRPSRKKSADIIAREWAKLG